MEGHISFLIWVWGLHKVRKHLKVNGLRDILENIWKTRNVFQRKTDVPHQPISHPLSLTNGWRSPTTCTKHVLNLSLYIHASLMNIHQLVQDIPHFKEKKKRICKLAVDCENRVKVNSRDCPKCISMKVKWKSSQRLVIYYQFKWNFHLYKSSYGLEKEVKVTKLWSALTLVQVMYPCKFGKTPSTGSWDIVGTRNCNLSPPVTLKMRSRSPNSWSALKLVPMMYPCKFGEIPSTG